jgi:ATP-dependent helicase/nuclease subunit A
MPEPKLTLEQQLACDLRRNLYVCAGAGSGKTEVLTRRLIRLLRQHRLELCRVLVVTFTDKAAGQMRDRVYRAIRQQLSLGDGHRSYWLGLKENFYSNYICTFHSFCAFILREYALEAGVDPDFIILDEHEQRDLLTQVVEREINRLAADSRSSSLSRLTRLWRRRAIVANLVRLIEARAQTGDWLAGFSSLGLEQYMERVEGYRRQAFSEQVDELTRSPLFREYLDTLDGLRRRLGHKTKTEAEKLARIGALYPRVKELDRLPVEAGIELLSQLYKQLNLQGLRDQQLKETLRGLRDLLDDSQLLDYHLEPVLEQEGYKLLSALADLGRRCLAAYQRQKQNNACLDFEDLQLLTLKLLQAEQHPHIRQQLRARFRYIMVDEFQDTNPVQWRILKLLASDEQGLAGDKLFLVGDEKQSIYAFRGADVTLFAQAKLELRQANIRHRTHRLPFELPDEYAAAYASLDESRRQRLLQGEVVLEHNFRSAKGVIDFLNPFFRRLFQRERYRLYDARPQAQSCTRRFPGARVELMLVEKEEAASSDRQQMDDYLKEAHLIAKKIKHILSARPVEYSRVLEYMEQGKPAIAILLVRRNKIKVYEEALRREDIAFLVSKGRGFYQRQEIMDIVNALEFINQPHLDIPLAGVLRSPLIGLSDDGLLAVASLEGRSLWDKLCSLFAAGTPTEWPAGLSADDIRLLPLAFRLLRSWVGLKDRLPLPELISKLLDDSQFYICLARGQRGPQNLANLEKLMELAGDFASAGGGGIGEWVNFLKMRLQGEEEGEAEVEPALGGTVQLMTIHQAKGLEFPLVFVPDLSTPFHRQNRDNLLMDNLTDGERGCWELGIKVPDPRQQFRPRDTLMRKIIARQQRRKELAERRRLLYVAATRAQDHLILVGQISAEPSPRAGCWQDWIRDILGLDSLAGRQAVSITNRQGEDISIPLTLFDPREEISSDRQPPTIRPAQVDRQVEQLAPSAELDEIIRRLKPLPILERPLLSPTSLLEYRRCPRGYYLRHYLGLPAWTGGQDPFSPTGGQDPFSPTKEDWPQNLGALRGTIVHSLLEDGISEEEPAPFRETRIDNLLPEGLSTEQREWLRQEVKRHVNQILGSQYYQQWSRLRQRSYRELRFKLEVGGSYLQGIIDQLHFDPERDEWVVVDYKTNELADEEEISKEIEQQGYDFQLRCYCWAASQLLAQPVTTAQLLFSHFPRLEELKFPPATWKDLVTEIEELGDRIIAHQFDPRPQDKNQCSTCSYQSICCLIQAR